VSAARARAGEKFMKRNAFADDARHV